MENKISIFFKKSYKILCGLMFLIFLVIILQILNNYMITASSNFIILLGAALYIMFLVLIYRKLDKLTSKQHNILAFIITIISFILLICFGLSHRVLFTYDLVHIVDKVTVLLKTNSHHVGAYQYFSKYPIQVPLFVLIYFVSLVGKIFFNNPDNTMIIYNCLMTAVSFYFVYLLLKELFNSKIALIGLIILALYPDFYLFTSYYYTDITSIPFTIIGIYCLIKANKMVKIKKYLLLIIGGILFAIASKLRIVSSFLLIAYIIDGIVKGNYKETLKKGVVVLSSFVLVYLLYSLVVIPYFKIDFDDNKKTPPTHWLMMGLNHETNGTYNWPDDNFTLSSTDKVNDNIMEIKKRIKKVNLDFFVKKIGITWSNGSGAFQYYRHVKPIDSTYAFISSYNSIYLQYLVRIMKMAMYILFVFTLAKEFLMKKFNSDNKVSTFIIAIFGGVLFYIFWESHFRYCFSFLPWVVIAGICSLPIVDKLLKTKTIKVENKKIDFIKFKKYLGYFIIIITGILICDNFINYAVRYSYLDVERLIQSGTSSRIDIIDSVITQKFKISKDFNKITLVTIDNHIKEEIPYIFELYDSNNKLIYKKEFMSSKNQGEISVVFNFSRIKLNKEKTFYFKIYSNEATKSNYLQIRTDESDNCIDYELTRSNKGYDAFKNSDTYVDDKLICLNANFNVYDNKYQNKISKKIYLPIALTLYILIILNVYNCLIKRG